MFRKFISRTTILNGAIAIVVFGLLFLSLRMVGPEAMRAWVEAAGVWAPVVFVLLKATTIVIAPLSGGFLYPLAGTLFGFWYGLALVVLGDAIGAIIAFWTSRTFGRAAVERMLGQETSALGRILEAIGTVRGFFITRVIFIMSQDLMSYAAGLTRLPFWPFIVIHVGVGVFPNALLTGAGALLTDTDTGARLSAIIAAIGVVGGLSALALVWYGSRPLTRKKAEDVSTPPPTQ